MLDPLAAECRGHSQAEQGGEEPENECEKERVGPAHPMQRAVNDKHQCRLNGRSDFGVKFPSEVGGGSLLQFVGPKFKDLKMFVRVEIPFIEPGCADVEDQANEKQRSELVFPVVRFGCSGAHFFRCQRAS